MKMLPTMIMAGHPTYSDGHRILCCVLCSEVLLSNLWWLRVAGTIPAIIQNDSFSTEVMCEELDVSDEVSYAAGNACIAV